MQKKPSFWNYIAGGCLAAALVFIVIEYADISEIASSAEISFYYIPMIIGTVLLAISAFVRQPRALAVVGFISLLISAVTRMFDSAESLQDFQESSREIGLHLESSESYFEAVVADSVISAVLFAGSLVAVVIYDLMHRKKDTWDKPFGKLPVCIPILCAVWKVIYKLINDGNDSFAKYVNDYFRNDTYEFVGQLLLIIGVAFFFAWLAYPVQVGSSYNAGVWQTPDDATMRAMQSPQNGQIMPPQPPQFMPPQPPQFMPPPSPPSMPMQNGQFMPPPSPQGTMPPQNKSAVFTSAQAAELQWYQMLLKRGSITPEEYEQKRQQLMRQ